MFRWFLICVLLAAGTVGVMYLAFADKSFLPTSAGNSADPTPLPKSDDKPSTGPRVDDRVDDRPPSVVEMGVRAGDDRIVIPKGRLYMVDKQDVPSERDGKLICIATDKDVEGAAPGNLVPDVTFAIPVIEVGTNEQLTETPVEIEGKKYRRLKPTDVLTPGKVKVYRVKRTLRKLQVGEKVEVGQLLAVVNPVLAIDELSAKIAKLDASEADVKVAIKTKLEAEKRWNAADYAYSKNAISADDWRGARLTWEKYIEEEVQKKEAVRVAQAEAQAAITTLGMYDIRAAVSGNVKQIYKNSLGEAVKNLESVLSIQSPNVLRVEATTEVQVARALKKGMPVIIEAAHPVPPAAQLGGHRSEVTCVAVSKGPEPMIVSGSEDQTVRIWARKQGKQDGSWLSPRCWEVQFGSAVRAVACTGPAAAQDLALIGAADGSLQLLDLKEMTTRPLAVRHPRAVNAVAFSPNGEICASGDDSQSIYLWDTAKRELLFTLRGAHRAPVTSLQFASNDRLVSAGRDERLVVWDVGSPTNPKVVREWSDRRGGSVTKLGVSPDGKYVLSDHGREIRRMSLETKQIEGVIANADDAQSFSDMALFSPDGLSVLTNGPGEGQLQLWRTPTADASRADELRQFIWTQGAATCGAFAPDASFAVTGTKDNQVLVWAMPKTEVVGDRRVLAERPLTATLTLVDESLDSTTRQVRVWAELTNPGWLTPGSRATIVVPTNVK
jgi:WD40 repeat protein